MARAGVVAHQNWPPTIGCCMIDVVRWADA
jgi:hypothetical protein